MAVRTISPNEVHRLASSGKRIELIDVRTPREFNSVHATVARSLPLDQLDPKAFLAARNGNSGEPLYIICASGMRSANACSKFIAAGFGNVFSVEGGTSAWARAGLPVVSTKKTLTVERQTRLVMGVLILTGVVLGFKIHPIGFGLSAFVGAGLIMAGLTDFCPLALLIARMPWNRQSAGACCQTA